jgi:hypothetical protein
MVMALWKFDSTRAAATRQPLRRTVRSCSADPCSQPLRTNILEVLLILYICCFVAEMIGVVWFYGKVPLKYSLIAPAVTVVLIGVAWRTLGLLQIPPDSSEVTTTKPLNC